MPIWDLQNKKVLLILVSQIAVAESNSLAPESGAYLGIGFNVNSTKFDDQKLTATGAFVSSSTAGGPAVGMGMDTEHGTSPSIQAGYCKKFENSNYL